MQKFRCDRPVFSVAAGVFPKISADLLAKEPCLLANSPTAVRAQGGNLGKLALAHVEECYAADIGRATKEGLSSCVDVRVQRLVPGMYPSVPGWHCDAVPRGSYHGQPNFEATHPRAFHVCVVLSTEPLGVSNTQFVDESMVFHIWDEEGRSRYQQLHAEVEKHNPPVIQCKDGQFVRYTQRTVHRAMPSVRRGWRMYFRYSMYEKPPMENIIGNQQQVYLLNEGNGW